MPSRAVRHVLTGAYGDEQRTGDLGDSLQGRHNAVAVSRAIGSSGCAMCRSVCRTSYPDLPACGIWPGVRRAGLPKPEPGADAGPAERRAHAGRWTDTGLIFTTRYGTPIEPRNFTRSFDLRIRRAGVRRITVHGTRKTCVTLQILRHSRISVTMEIYTEATSEATRAALKRLGDELSQHGQDEPHE